MAMKSIYRNKTFDMYTNDVLYLIGVYFGDGSLRKQYRDNRQNSFEFSFGTIDKEFIDKVSDIVFDLRGTRPKITSKVEKKTLFYRLSFGFQNFNSWLYQESNNKTRIPAYIKELPEENLKYFLAGYFDSDGWVSERKRKNVVHLSSKNMSWAAGWDSVSEWAIDMKLLFEKVGFKVGTFKKRNLSLNNPNHRDIYTCSLSMWSFLEIDLPLVVNRKKNRIINYRNSCNPQRLYALHS